MNIALTTAATISSTEQISMYKLNWRQKLTFAATAAVVLLMLLGNTPCGELDYNAVATATASAKIEEMLEYRDSQHSAATRIAERKE